LTVLSEVSAIIASSLDLKEVLKSIMEMATKIMRAEASSLMLIDEKTQELIFEEVLGEKEEEVKKIRLKKGEGIAGWVAEYGIPLLIPDAYKDPRFNPEVDKSTGFKTRSILCVPMKVKDKIIGVVEVLNRIDKKPFDEDDKEIFSILANHAAIAIENARLYKQLRELFLGTVKSLAEAIDAKSPYTRGHSERVSEYSLMIAKELNLSKEEQETVQIAGLLHDIGKIGIDEEILNKPGKLTEEEYFLIKKHPEIGAEIIQPVSYLQKITPAVKHHQERYDGGGYPDGLRGEEIPFIARILAVADTFDAMTSTRPYREKLNYEDAISEIEKNRGTQFDPEVVDAFLNAYKKRKIVKREE
jgi:putative nucleotidyltransferase with HDIG domain